MRGLMTGIERTTDVGAKQVDTIQCQPSRSRADFERVKSLAEFEL
jgi:hypothetical protein